VTNEASSEARNRISAAISDLLALVILDVADDDGAAFFRHPAGTLKFA